ncbi:MAG: CDP-alcohol phosphatidyltransferase family protein [Oligoflexia bacterium]|nr:CDP-alcohol phosphatidyltransferase family protein [Oligoflexia bacterium]
MGTFFDLFMGNQQWIYTLVLIGLAVIMGGAYFIRSLIRGRERFDRVEKQGGSALLSKEMMEAFYWFLQPLGKFLVYCRITANGVSWTSFVFGAVAGLCLAFGHFGSGAAFATVSAVLDSLDGLVARMSHTASDAGEVLDAAVDRYAEFFFLGGLVIYYREVPVLMVLTLLALAGSFMVSYSTAKAEALHVEAPKGSMRRPERALYLILGAALSPVTIPVFEATSDFPIPIGHPMVIALCLVAVLANVSAVERLWTVAHAMRLREAEAARVAAATAMEEHADAQEHVDGHKVTR